MLKSIENCEVRHVLCDSNGHFIGILHLSLLKTLNQRKINANIKAHLCYHSSFYIKEGEKQNWYIVTKFLNG
jgi:hypothetical protein